MFNIANILNQLAVLLTVLQANVKVALGIVAIFWIVFFINLLLGYRLNIFGIYPRRLWGLPGILFSPFLHANFNHLFFNSIPLFVFSDFLLVYGRDKFLHISLIIILCSGLGIWLFGRKAIHVGASSLIMGYFSFLLVMAYRQPSVLTILLAIVTIYYFGALFLDLFPREKHVSWEGHLFGFLAGLIAAYWINF